MNELLFLLQVLFCFSAALAMFRWWGRAGLFAWVVFASVVCNIEVVKCVTLFGLDTTLGNIFYGSTFLATDILSELYGGREARRAVLLGFLGTLVFLAVIQTGLLYVPNQFDLADDALHQVFAFLPRAVFASVFSFLVSNTLDTYSYDLIRRLFPKSVWLRNNGSTMTSQLVDSLLFWLIGFQGVFPPAELLEMGLTTYAVKVAVAALDTPFLYMARRLAPERA
jgi:uncharacterized integral membrane protein (TIGR00697 family)